MTTARNTRRTAKKDEWQAAFLAKLMEAGNVSEAAATAGVSRRFVYSAREQDTVFASAWDEALDVAVDVMEREAFRRAVEGTEEPVYSPKGFKVGSVRKYSDTLLIFLMKGARPAKYRETTKNINVNLTPEQAAAMTDQEIEAKLKEKGLL